MLNFSLEENVEIRFKTRQLLHHRRYRNNIDILPTFDHTSQEAFQMQWSQKSAVKDHISSVAFVQIRSFFLLIPWRLPLGRCR